MIGVKNNSATQPSKGWRCRSALKFSYCQSFSMMKLPFLRFWVYFMQEKDTITLYSLTGPNLKEDWGLCSTLWSCWQALEQALWSEHSCYGLVWNIVPRCSNADIWNRRWHIKSERKLISWNPCLRRRTDIDGQMEMLNNTSLSSKELESRIWPPLHILTRIQCFKRPQEVPNLWRHEGNRKENLKKTWKKREQCFWSSAAEGNLICFFLSSRKVWLYPRPLPFGFCI